MRYELARRTRPAALLLAVVVTTAAATSSDAQLTPNGDQFQVNTYTTSFQPFPDLAVAPSGDFVVTWTSYSLRLMRTAALTVIWPILVSGSMLGPDYERPKVVEPAEFRGEEGKSEAESIAALNNDVKVVPHRVLLRSDNALDILKDYEVVINGSDNFPTRYLVNDACALLGIPLVDGSIFRFEGQVTVFDPAHGGPCYRWSLSRPAAARRGAELRPGWGVGCAAGYHRQPAGQRGHQADPGHRRAAHRPADAL